jgi:hypothetical protein
MEVSGQLHAPAAKPPGKNPSVPIGEEPVWAPKSILALWSRKNFLPLPGIETRRPSRSPSLYRLSYPGFKKNTIPLKSVFYDFEKLGSLLGRERDFSFHHRAQRSSGNYLASHAMGIRERAAGV